MRMQEATKVGEIMTRDVISVKLDASVAEILEKMVSHNISGVVVVDSGGDVVGVVSALDIFKLADGNPEMSFNYTAEDIMTPYTISVTPDTTVEEAARAMLENGIHRLVVTASPTRKKPLGIVTSTDVLRVLGERAKEFLKQKKS
ncbi:MAG: CBS domain-containing protein [Euryarchaeota archaeon]|nr:CBS domain-containing protein [Euryarchaeota archaeon]